MSHAHTSLGKHPRVFKTGEHDIFINAGYHRQEWGPIPHAGSELLGTYETSSDGTVTVSLVDGISGHAEYELAWDLKDDGTHRGKVTVLDDATALQYLAMCGAATVED